MFNLLGLILTVCGGPTGSSGTLFLKGGWPQYNLIDALHNLFGQIKQSFRAEVFLPRLQEWPFWSSVVQIKREEI